MCHYSLLSLFCFLVIFTRKSYQWNPFDWGKIKVPIIVGDVQRIYKIFGKIQGWFYRLYENPDDFFKDHFEVDYYFKMMLMVYGTY